MVNISNVAINPCKEFPLLSRFIAYFFLVQFFAISEEINALIYCKKSNSSPRCRGELNLVLSARIFGFLTIGRVFMKYHLRAKVWNCYSFCRRIHNESETSYKFCISVETTNERYLELLSLISRSMLPFLSRVTWMSFTGQLDKATLTQIIWGAHANLPRWHSIL